MSVRRSDAPRMPAASGPVLESLYQHRLLSTRQLHELHTPGARMRWMQTILAGLRNLQLASAVKPSTGPLLWFLTPRGLEAVETVPGRAEMRRKIITPAQASGPLRKHTIAVNDVGIAFVRAARREGDECGPLAWRHEIANPIGPPPGRHASEQLIADALLTYQRNEPNGATSFHYRFIELDRATLAVDDLATKLTRYTRLYHYTPTSRPISGEPRALWRQTYAVFPSVLVALAGRPRTQLQRRRSTTLALCATDPTLTATPQVEIKICLLEDLAARGPFDAIFHSVTDRDQPTPWLTPVSEREESSG